MGAKTRIGHGVQRHESRPGRAPRCSDLLTRAHRGPLAVDDRPAGERAVRHPSEASDPSRNRLCPPAATSTLAVVAKVVLRVRLIAGDRLDVTYEEDGIAEADEVADRAIASLADNSGMIRARHGDRLIVVYGRGVAALEVAPRGAIL
jgi:hypothetical protein